MEDMLLCWCVIIILYFEKNEVLFVQSINFYVEVKSSWLS